MSNEEIHSPLFVGSLHLYGTVERLLTLPILAPSLSWTRWMVYALQNYAKWQQTEAPGVSGRVPVRHVPVHSCVFFFFDPPHHPSRNIPFQELSVPPRPNDVDSPPTCWSGGSVRRQRRVSTRRVGQAFSSASTKHAVFAPDRNAARTETASWTCQPLRN